MKKTIPIFLLITFFIATYFVLSFCVPGWQIKLEAEPSVIFIETLKILWPIKALISLVVGSVFSAALGLILKKRKNK